MIGQGNAKLCFHGSGAVVDHAEYPCDRPGNAKCVTHSGEVDEPRPMSEAVSCCDRRGGDQVSLADPGQPGDCCQTGGHRFEIPGKRLQLALTPDELSVRRW